MSAVTLEARKTPEPENPDSWTIKISGMTFEDLKELSLRASYGLQIRYDGPDQPFLMAKRPSESAGTSLGESMVARIHETGYRMDSRIPVPGKEIVWKFTSSRAA